MLSCTTFYITYISELNCLYYFTFTFMMWHVRKYQSLIILEECSPGLEKLDDLQIWSTLNCLWSSISLYYFLLKRVSKILFMLFYFFSLVEEYFINHFIQISFSSIYIFQKQVVDTMFLFRLKNKQMILLEYFHWFKSIDVGKKNIL